MSTLKVNKVQHLNSTGDGLVVDNKGTVGIATNDLELNTTLVGAASSLVGLYIGCLLYTSPSPRDNTTSRMPSSA